MYFWLTRSLLVLLSVAGVYLHALPLKYVVVYSVRDNSYYARAGTMKLEPTPCQMTAGEKGSDPTVLTAVASTGTVRWMWRAQS